MTTETPVPLSFTELERQTLETEFGDGLGATLSTAVSALRPVVLRLIGAGATRAHLLQIGRARGHKPAYVRAVISQILVRLARRRKRKSGAGPKTPWLAKVILAIARQLVGDKARKYLLAAAHLAKVEDEQNPGQCYPCPDRAAVGAILRPPRPLPLIYKS